jgi:hypothetical protein
MQENEELMKKGEIYAKSYSWTDLSSQIQVNDLASKRKSFPNPPN